MIVSVISNEHQFREEFKQMGRGDQFTHEGLGLLFDYLDQLSDDCGQQIELDVISICCDYAEDKPEDIALFYSIDIDEVMEYLHDNSIVVGETDEGTIVYRQF
jgi:hypothetical protein